MAVIAVGSICFLDTAGAQLPFGRSPKGGPSPAATEKGKKGSALSSKDKSFMMNAAKGGMMEVEWGKLAAEKGIKHFFFICNNIFYNLFYIIKKI